jgi:hypothetical protein
MSTPSYTFPEHAHELLSNAKDSDNFTQWLVEHKVELLQAFERNPQVIDSDQSMSLFVRWAWILYAMDSYQHLVQLRKGQEYTQEQELFDRLLDQAPEELCPNVEYSLDPLLVTWATESLEFLQDTEITRLDRRLRHLGFEECLCGSTGRELLAEYGWDGSLEEILERGESLLEVLQEREMTEIDRLEWIDRRCRLLRYRYFRRQQIQAAYPARRVGPSPQIQRWILERRMHRRKECLCYLHPNEE